MSRTRYDFGPNFADNPRGVYYLPTRTTDSIEYIEPIYAPPTEPLMATANPVRSVSVLGQLAWWPELPMILDPKVEPHRSASRGGDS